MNELFSFIILFAVGICAAFYPWLWYHVQSIWIKNPIERRPFTYIMRDIAHRVPLLVIVVSCVAGHIFGDFMFTPSHLFAFLVGMLMAHLFFGEPWVPQQQEDPPYCPDKIEPK